MIKIHLIRSSDFNLKQLFNKKPITKISRMKKFQYSAKFALTARRIRVINSFKPSAPIIWIRSIDVLNKSIYWFPHPRDTQRRTQDSRKHFSRKLLLQITPSS